MDPVAAFTGCFPALLRPWSPSGALLALQCREGICVVDATRPDEPAPTLVPGPAYVVWSPDGRWLAGLVFRQDLRTRRELIIATPVTGGRKDTLFDGRRAFPCVWASNDSFYYWGDDGDPRERHAVRAPSASPTEKQRPLSQWTDLLIGTVEGRANRALRYWRFSVDPEPRQEPVFALDSLASSGLILYGEALADGPRFLIHRPATLDHPGSTFVVDARGALLDTLGGDERMDDSSHVAWRSVSSDGRYVVGEQTIAVGDTILSLKLFLGDVHGRWRAEIPGTDGALRPRLSREGFFIAYQQHDSLKIGRLEVEPR